MHENSLSVFPLGINACQRLNECKLDIEMGPIKAKDFAYILCETSACILFGQNVVLNLADKLHSDLQAWFSWFLKKK